MIPQPYRILALVLLWLGSLAAVGIWQHSAGVDSTQAKWEAREATQQVQAASAIKTLQESARAAEQKHAQDMATIATNYQKELTDANRQRVADLAAVRAGTLRLYDRSASVPTCADTASQAATAPGIGDGRAPGQLSDAAAGFLLGLASDCDDLARQLGAAQQVIKQDRETEMP